MIMILFYFTRLLHKSTSNIRDNMIGEKIIATIKRENNGTDHTLNTLNNFMND